MKLLCALLVAVVALSAVEAKTRRTSNVPKRVLESIQLKDLMRMEANERIVGGSPANDGQFPYIVSLQDGSFHFCGGSILDSRTILTAAHCVPDENANGLRVVAGSLTHSAVQGQAVDVQSITVHNLYNSNTQANDIAILHLSGALSLGGNVAAISLPASGREESAGSELVVSGWGTTSSGGSVSPNLLYVRVPYVTDTVCSASYNGIIDSMLCAGTAGRDSCQGDSGGPLYSDNGYQAGIVSWGIGCALAGFPGVYTQTSYFIDWINNNS